eukprot:377767-Amphidinium_carterae.2
MSCVRTSTQNNRTQGGQPMNIMNMTAVLSNLNRRLNDINFMEDVDPPTQWGPDNAHIAPNWRKSKLQTF